jgi:chorismate-pyruvate lyase
MNMTKEILKKQNTNTRKNISEVRVEEVHDIGEEKVFWRIYYTIDEKIVILAESLINPQLVRYKSRYL